MIYGLNRHLIVKKRFLTQAEKQLAISVFGTSLQFEHIQIIAHRLVLKHFAISPNGNIYFHPADWTDDFSQETILKQSWFIHELVHVWQVQQGIKLIRQGLFDRKYRYALEQGKQFLHYGIEQQAQMVQDYFIRLHTGQSCRDLAECIPFIPRSPNHND
ncbi:type IV secretion protein Rhs [Acinetobacter sp. S40]|uniref:type IV secretion protein Rhs n=1 Tax=unclassified Acinetobacter TaxID=196816 RepID=UPI0019097BB8|nr:MULTISPECIES: type IV secretion protein Rhs [unclassified Acinetobacter]MBJ9986411.1 type IV secretion protein Rhs [Acinetobacter sp. S40]MBK0063685.1 type IV secretion protein Rhs [Acinetobacter sp. S55]MBK0067563.1 type IV secretion protein Rhs [Acinetobacter sp. S54]